MAKNWKLNKQEVVETIDLDRPEIWRYPVVSMPETKLNVEGNIVFVDSCGNVWDPQYDDRKGEKEDWEAEMDNFPDYLDPRL